MLCFGKFVFAIISRMFRGNHLKLHQQPGMRKEQGQGSVIYSGGAEKNRIFKVRFIEASAEGASL